MHVNCYILEDVNGNIGRYIKEEMREGDVNKMITHNDDDSWSNDTDEKDEGDMEEIPWTECQRKSKVIKRKAEVATKIGTDGEITMDNSKLRNREIGDGLERTGDD